MRYVGRGGVAAGVVWVRERRMKSGCGEGRFVLVSTGATRDVMDALQLNRSDGTKSEAELQCSDLAGMTLRLRGGERVQRLGRTNEREIG